ncbi:L-cysteine desulfidase family protein [Porphyromonas gingivicanis]|uniref:L-cysteine desulfidase family protein n=1 Tax=Porphyromonas gingivicanis TaxID=266762 RepID=UPI00046E83B7|nr:L-serine ammonia-lyase, iron-sulfur-dependent, subunit alpha [Porphyromonas gingivicanis]
MDISIEQQCIDLIKSEVIPATGCTEPVAVALATAKASAVLGEEPKEIEVLLSANMLKNAMGVGIPGTGMIGLPIAIALGIIIAEPEKELTVLEDFSKEQLEAAKRLVEKKIIAIKLKEGEVDKLYIEVNLKGAQHSSSVIILSNHRNIIFVERDNKTLFGERATLLSASNKEESNKEELQLSFGIVYDFATKTPLEKIEFIMEAARLNQAASEYSLKSEYGHAVGRMIQGELGKRYLGTSSLTEMLTYTSAACDARMDGAPVTVMSNSGSGNQGITATLPVLTFARKENKSHEETVRALVLSNLMVIYVKQKLGRLSALCGCVVAATGSSCGLTYLMGGTREQVGFAIKNMVGNITGMLCDGAKPSCSMKVSSGVSTAMFSALLAMEHKVVTSNEGIVDDDVDRTIENLTGIGRVGMNETDRLVLDIMTKKQQ